MFRIQYEKKRKKRSEIYMEDMIPGQIAQIIDPDSHYKDHYVFACPFHQHLGSGVHIMDLTDFGQTWCSPNHLEVRLLDPDEMITIQISNQEESNE
jgi:hypothetical protein